MGEPDAPPPLTGRQRVPIPRSKREESTTIIGPDAGRSPSFPPGPFGPITVAGGASRWVWKELRSKETRAAMAKVAEADRTEEVFDFVGKTEGKELALRTCVAAADWSPSQ